MRATLASIRRFHASFSFHVMHISLATIVLSVLLTSILFGLTLYFASGATIAEMMGEDPVAWYLMTTCTFIASIFASAMLISSVFVTHAYSVEMLKPYAKEHFHSRNEVNPFEENQSSEQIKISKAPKSLPQNFNTQPAPKPTVQPPQTPEEIEQRWGRR